MPQQDLSQKVYGLYMAAHDGYRNNQTKDMPTDTAAQGIYEVVDGKRSSDYCCWDFGNASTDNCYGTTNALYFGAKLWGVGAGSTPSFMGDFGSSLWPPDPLAGVWGFCGEDPSNPCPDYPSVNAAFAFGVLKTDQTNAAIRIGNAQSGDLTTAYEGQVPISLQMQGGIVLGIDSENGNSSYGTFFEGAITAGRPSNATDEAVLRNVQAAQYGK